MATHDYDIANQSGAAFRTDLNNALAAIQSNNSNSSSPATTVAYQWWADTSNNVMKIRNSANNAWVELFQLDGTLTLEDGSASTPALAFRDDLNTGIFSPNADEIAFSCAGTERVRIDSNGKVGVNTAAKSVTPQKNLHIAIDSEPSFLLTNDTTTHTDGSGTELKLDSSGNFELLQRENLNVEIFTNNTQRMTIDGSGRTLFGLTTSQTIGSTTHALEQIVVTANQTCLSLARFENAAGGPVLNLGKSRGSSGVYTVVQDGDTLGNINFAGADGTDLVTVGASITAKVDGTPGSNDLPTELIFSTTADGASSVTDRLVINSSGSVGIGTSSPASQLHVYDSAAANDTPEIQIESFRPAIRLKDRSGSSASAEIVGDDCMKFSVSTPVDDSTALTERMRLDSSGNLGIGVTSIDSALHVYKQTNDRTARFQRLSGQHLDITQTSGINSFTSTGKNFEIGTTDSTDMIFDTAGSERMRLSSSGTLSIGTTDNSVAGNNVQGISLDGANGYFAANRSADESFGFGRGNAGQVGRFFNGGTNVGNISVASSTTAYNTSMSDRSKKKNFEDWTEDTLKIFKNLNPQKFNFITEDDSEEKTKGFIAQDLVDSFPEAYPVDDKDGKYWFNPSGMVVYLMKAIQELEAKVAVLEAT